MDKLCIVCGRAFKTSCSRAKYCSTKCGRKVWNVRPKGKYIQSPKYNRKFKLKARYGITNEQYWDMVNKQKGLCAICGKTNINKKTKTLTVDHNHVTGKVRGLLCTACNMKLAVVENKKFCRKAHTYLAKYKGKKK